MAKTPETVDLMFLARQIERLISDVANIRDEMDVHTAIILRLDANQGAF